MYTFTAGHIWDDGPPRKDNNNVTIGHELEAGAVAGDGVFYCDQTFTTPSQPGDYYFDIDRYGQRRQSIRLLTSVWGFSTLRFVSNPTTFTDLLVCDYTEGQTFPFTLNGDPRFAGANPIESYLLTNPAGDIVNTTVTPPTVVRSSDKTTFKNVNVWRILARGPVPADIINNYLPQPDLQINPADVVQRHTVPSLPKDRPVTVATAGIVGPARTVASYSRVQGRLLTLRSNPTSPPS